MSVNIFPFSVYGRILVKMIRTPRLVLVVVSVGVVDWVVVAGAVEVVAEVLVDVSVVAGVLVVVDVVAHWLFRWSCV